jgi:hypothetical protein
MLETNQASYSAAASQEKMQQVKPDNSGVLLQQDLGAAAAISQQTHDDKSSTINRHMNTTQVSTVQHTDWCLTTKVGQTTACICPTGSSDMHRVSDKEQHTQADTRQ